MHPKRASRTRLHRVLLGLAAAGLIASGCGDDSDDGPLLTRRQADELRGTLTQVEQDLSAENCTGAEQQVAAFKERVDSINRLDRDLRSALRASGRRLETLVSTDCATPAPETQTETQTTPTTPEEGTTGTTGTTGEDGKKPKKPKKEKPTPEGQDEQPPSVEGDEGGGAAPPDEIGADGDAGQ